MNDTDEEIFDAITSETKMVDVNFLRNYLRYQLFSPDQSTHCLHDS